MDSVPDIRNKLTLVNAQRRRGSMLRIYRGYIFATVIALGLVAGGIVFGLMNEAAYTHHAYGQAAQRAKNSADHVRKSCLRLVRSKQADCLHEGAEKYRLEKRDNERDYDDLIAQQTSALWAAVMGVSALIGMAISVLGVFLVWLTFSEQRAANKIARQDAVDAARNTEAALRIAERNAYTAEQQLAHQEEETFIRLRAYVHLGETVIVPGDHGWVGGTTKFQNFGQTPAVNVGIMVSGTSILPNEGADVAVNAAFPVDRSAGRSIVQGRHSIGQIGPFSPNEITEAAHGRKKIIITAKAEYDDVIKGRPHQTREVWELKIKMGRGTDGSYNLTFDFFHVPGFWIGT